MNRELIDSKVDWIREIPEDWKLFRTGTLFNVRNKKVSDKDYAPLTVGKMGVVPQLEQVAKTDDNDNRKLVKRNDFVINSRSDRKQSCGVSDLDGSVSLINIVLFPKDMDVVIPSYVNILMKNISFAEEFYRWGHGIVADLWTTRWQEMKSIVLPLPEKSEQLKIFAKLSNYEKKLNELIANQQQQIENLKQYKQSLITEAVTKGLDPSVPTKDSGEDFIGNIPVNWQVVKYGQIAEIKTNLVEPSQYGDYYQISPDCIEKAGELITEKIKTVAQSGVISWNHLFSKGQIIYSKIRPLLNKVVIAPFDGLCSADMYPIETKQSTHFILYLMRSSYFVKQVERTTLDRVKMPKINQTEIAELIVVIPPVNEQNKIASILDAKTSHIDKLILIKQSRIDKLNQYKQSLIYEYVTGKKEA